LFHGLMDEVVLFARRLSGNEITAIYSAGAAGICKPEPGTPVILVNGVFDPAGIASATNSAQIDIRSTFPNGYIFYSLDGSDPDSGLLYSGPFTIAQSAIVQAVAYS